MLIGAFRLAVSLFAAILIAVGVVLAPSPIPIGIVFIAIGFALLAWSAPGFIRWLRRRWPWFDRRVVALEERLPPRLAEMLRRTDLDDEDVPSDSDLDDAAVDVDALAREGRRRRHEFAAGRRQI